MKNGDKAAARAIGVEPGGTVGLNAFDLYGNSGDSAESMRRTLAGEPHKSTTEVEGRILETRYTPRRGPGGALNGMVGITHDITEQVRARHEIDRQTVALREQAELLDLAQQEIIRAQALAIEELSTPLIPIADEILVMPLIGMMDSARAQQVMHSLLSGLAANRGKYAIIDITGVPVVDTAVANALLRAAHAARLLGTEVILTGIRPEVAQTLVNIEANLSNLTTCGTLQAGIAYALARRGRKSL